MEGVHWIIRNADQQKRIMQLIMDWPYPFQVKVSRLESPKTAKQIRYAHSLCNALAAGKEASPAEAKRDAKAAFGVVVVSTSLITGDRSARLKSFADYTKDEMEAFCTAMEAYLTDAGIPFECAS